MTWDSDSERILLAASCRDNFWRYFQYAWGSYTSPKARDTWYEPAVHKPMCDWFELHIKEWLSWRAQGIKRQKFLAVLVPREWWKTTIFTQAGSSWLHLQDTELAVGIGSENVTKAGSFLSTIKNIISGNSEHALFPWLYGNWEDPTRTWTNDGIVHAARKSLERKEPSFTTWGVATGLTAGHYDALFFDDPISYEKLEQDAGWFMTVRGHVDSFYPVLQANGLMVWVGTRYHGSDHFGEALDNMGGIKTITGMSPPDLQVRPDGVCDMYWMDGEAPDGSSTHPKVWPKWKLERFKRSNRTMYAHQIRNDTTQGDFNIFTREQFDECWVDPKDVPYNQLWIAIHGDKAFKKPEQMHKGDETTLTVSGHLRDGSGVVYYLEGYGGNDKRAEWYYDQIVYLVQKWRNQGSRRVIGFTDETEIGGGEGNTELHIKNKFSDARLICPPLYFFRRSTQKDKISRIINAARFWNDGRVKVVRGSPGSMKLRDQMTNILGNLHDDYADPFADAFDPAYYMPARILGPVGSKDKSGFPHDDILKGKLNPWPEDRFSISQERHYDPVQ
jgi:hypothetical protein